jgi:hypothetical protein
VADHYDLAQFEYNNTLLQATQKLKVQRDILLVSMVAFFVLHMKPFYRDLAAV